MTTEQATLIAAVIAAVAATLQIVISAITSRNSEFRAAHRRMLEPYIQDIGLSVHQILASSKMYLKRYGKQQSLDNWRSRAEDAVHKLKEIRWKVRYPLWGIDEGLRVITRVFHWVSHLQDYPDNAEKLFKAGDNLRKALDEAIKNSYRGGRPPNTIEIWRVNFRVWQLKQERNKIFEQINDAALKAQLSETPPD